MTSREAAHLPDHAPDTEHIATSPIPRYPRTNSHRRETPAISRSHKIRETRGKRLAQPQARIMMNLKTAALCTLALVSGLELASAFRGSGAPSMPGPIEAAASSQLPSQLTRGLGTRALNPAMKINRHRSMVSMTSDSLPADSTRSAGLVPSLPLIVSTPQLVVTTDSAGFSSIPVGAPRAGHKKVSLRSLEWGLNA